MLHVGCHCVLCSIDDASWWLHVQRSAVALLGLQVLALRPPTVHARELVTTRAGAGWEKGFRFSIFSPGERGVRDFPIRKAVQQLEHILVFCIVSFDIPLRQVKRVTALLLALLHLWCKRSCLVALEFASCSSVKEYLDISF